MQSNHRYSLAVLGFAVILVATFVIGIQQNWGIFRQPTKEGVTNADAANELAFEADAVDLASLDLIMNIVPPSSGEEVRALTFEIDDLMLYIRDDDDSVIVTEICLDYVSLILQPQEEQTAQSLTLNRAPYCLPVEDIDYFEEEVDFGVFTLDRFYWLTPDAPEGLKAQIDDADFINLNFWYPYDNFKLDMVLQAQYTLTLDDGGQITGTIIPYIEWHIQTSGTRLWDIKVETAPDLPIDPLLIKDYLGADSVYDRYTITFNRLLLYRIIFPFFMIAMVLLLCFMPLFSERDSLIDVSAAMLFGIFGLKGIIGPGEQMGQTVMDIALIGLYVLLAFAVLMFFMRRIFGPRSQTE
ncbi:hypothetical protein HC776_00600 [bacterium]|nr:hypothetical protein [bacterium]